MGLVLIAVFFLLTWALSYLRNSYSYWAQRGIPQLRPHFLYGHFFKLTSVDFNELLQETYNAFKGKCMVAGTYIFTRPVAVVTDLDLVKAILIKDFNKFVDRSDAPFPSTIQRNPLVSNLFTMHGEEWRALRTKLSPTFTSGKIKYMFNTIAEIGEQLGETIENEIGPIEKGGSILEIHGIIGRYTVDVIGNCAFGIECNSLKDPQAEFRILADKLFIGNSPHIRWALFRMNYSKYLSKLPFRTFAQDHIGFFVNVVRQTIEHRERDNIRRNDFMDLLLDLRKSEHSKGFTLEQLAAQILIFFIAGFETSSSNASYALFELSKNEDIQNKVRAEIQSVLQKHGKLTYDAMMEMTYLDKVVSETLRKYPALFSLTRMASEDYRLPSGDADSPNSKIVLERGTKIYIPVGCIHFDPEIYPEPHKFQPERFEPEACQQRHPLAFLGFGDGPRNCIGLRFGRMQSKVALITLLSAYRFSQVPGEPTEVPISRLGMIRRPANGVRLHVERL